WREHHNLVIEDRHKEELLTDVTTVVLGFGILSTNNTDRYRSTGTWNVTAWSKSSAGYLPPQAMAYLLALWCAAREKPEERKTIAHHLEPNQRACFRAALEVIDNGDESVREHVTHSAPSRPIGVVHPDAFVPREPAPDEIAEPQYVAIEQRRDHPVYRTPKGGTLAHAYAGGTAGGVLGFFGGLAIFGEGPLTPALLSAAIGAILLAAFMIRRSRRDVCTACETDVVADVAVCRGCGGTIGRRVTASELRELRLEELEQRARSVEYDDCEDCQPERPCSIHRATEAIGSEPEVDHSEPDEPQVAKPSRARPILTATAAIAVIATLAFAWWRQNRVPVYFDNAVGRPLTIRVDGEQHPLPDRLSLVLKLPPANIDSYYTMARARSRPTTPSFANSHSRMPCSHRASSSTTRWVRASTSAIASSTPRSQPSANTTSSGWDSSDGSSNRSRTTCFATRHPRSTPVARR
ncbi:MAG TPA: hypothetical protein VF608_15495, partial [Thermoanaerobaculia bacterium]